jgi:phospholipid transport system substrate-binding protein
MKATLLTLVISSLFLFPLTSSAVNDTQGQANEQSVSPGTPSDILREGVVDKLTAFVRKGCTRDRDWTMAFLQEEIAPYFDFDYMTQWAAGPAYRHMDTTQRTALKDQLTGSFLPTLAQRLTTYGSREIRYFTGRGSHGTDVTVSAWIMQPHGYSSRLDFRFYKSAEGWKIFDVKTGGNSAVLYYRNQFRHLPGYSNPGRV